MTKIYILFLLLFFSSSFSQTYQFDLVTNYTSSSSKYKLAYDNVNYFNSDDFSYYLKISNRENELKGILGDPKNNLVHHFKVIQSKLSNEIQFQFVYNYSSVINADNDEKDYRFELLENPTVSSKEVVLKIYRTKKAKKPFLTQTLTLITANKNLFPIYCISVHDHFWSYNEFIYPGNYIVSKAIEKIGNQTCEINLKEYKNVDLQITLPKELNFQP